MADKNSNEFRNGRRSRGGSPHSEENSDGSDSDQGRQRRTPYFSSNTVFYCDRVQFFCSFLLGHLPFFANKQEMSVTIGYIFSVFRQWNEDWGGISS